LPSILLALLSVLQIPASMDAYPDSVVSTVSTGQHPRGVCCHPDGGTVYLAIGYGYVPVISTADWSIEGFIAVGESPSDLCILPSGDLVFVTDDSEAVVRVIETSTNTVIAEIDLPYPGVRAAAVPPGDFVAVLHETGHMTLIDAETLVVAGTYWAGYSPGGLCALPGGGTLYVTDRNSSSAGSFDMESRTLERFFVGGDSYDVCALPDQELLYLNLRDWDMLEVVSLPENTPVGEIQGVGTAPARLCALASGGYVYVTDDQEDVVRIVRTSDRTVVGSVAVGPEPAGICSSPSGEMIFVANSGGSTMSVIGISSTGIEGDPGPDLTEPRVSPNPCSGTARLTFELANLCRVRVSVYTTDGRLLDMPVDGEYSPGVQEWMLEALPAGLFHLVVETPAGRSILTLVSL
jgi:DNA-binding beta-propeller fold protein YncE